MPRENAAPEQGSPQSDMFEPAATVSDAPRRESPQDETPAYESPYRGTLREEGNAESYQDQTPVPPPAPAPAAPQRVYTTPPRSFQAVSQHDESAEESHRPNRRRRQHAESEAAQEPPLQLVETQSAPQPAAVEDQTAHRRKPRRRRGSQSANEPLQLVETQGTVEPGTDNIPAP
jgi:hypothetical protein